MIVSSKTINDFGNYGGVARCNVGINVHDNQHGSESATVSFNFGNASMLFHLSEKNLRDLAWAMDEAANVMTDMKQVIDELLQQIKRNYGDDVASMPDDLAAYYIAHTGKDAQA